MFWPLHCKIGQNDFTKQKKKVKETNCLKLGDSNNWFPEFVKVKSTFKMYSEHWVHLGASMLDRGVLFDALQVPFLHSGASQHTAGASLYFFVPALQTP